MRTSIKVSDQLHPAVGNLHIWLWKCGGLKREGGCRAAGNASVENWDLEAPVSTDPSKEPFMLYPWKPSDVGPVGNIKLPAHFWEPVIGAWWLYDYKANAEHESRDLPTTLSQIATLVTIVSP